MNDASSEFQQLQAVARRHRGELQHGLRELRRALAATQMLPPLLRRSLPLMPYAATAAGVALLVMLLRRRQVPPALITAGAALDALRVWMLLRRPDG